MVFIKTPLTYFLFTYKSRKLYKKKETMNKKDPQDQHHTSLSLIISLCLHIAFIIYLLINQYDHQPTFPLKNKENPSLIEKLSQKNDTEWVETKTRPCPAGAAVFFRDDYQDSIMHEPQHNSDLNKIDEPLNQEPPIAEKQELEKEI